MRLRWIVLVALLAGSAAATLLAVRTFTGLTTNAQAQVRSLPPGHQEVAWIAPATSHDAWERLVAALKQLQNDWPKLHAGQKLQIDLDRAFLDLTADVPEIGVAFAGAETAKLWIRWYKLSGENPSRTWVANLLRRKPPPLAVVGGDTSDRALALAEALQDARDRWAGKAPLLLITTATAERYLPKDRPSGATHDVWPKLMNVYPARSFRFAFTNTRMVQAVLGFIRQTPQVWPMKHAEAALFAGVAAGKDPWLSVGLLAAGGHFQPYSLYALEWGDDGYSKDLAEIFVNESMLTTQDSALDFSIHYSVGDHFQANPPERRAVQSFLNNRSALPDKHQLLVLPTGAQRARRFLRTLCRTAPTEMRNVVVVNGDAVSFNTIYRDRDVAWNILDMPVPLVFFSHRDPIDRAAGFDPHKAATGTQDLLLYRDMLEAMLDAAFEDGRLVTDADRAHDRLRQLRWRQGRLGPPGPAGNADGSLPFFEAEGNRSPGTGEHIVWLHPAFEGARNLPRATITVWHVANGGWRLSGAPLEVLYNQGRADGMVGN